MKKNDHYSMDNILKTNADYITLLGERANGKSFQAKAYVIRQYFETGKHFVYLRRAQIEVRAQFCNEYFADAGICELIKALSKGRYNCISFYGGKFFFATLDSETYKIKRGELFGYSAYLSGATHFKSALPRGKISTIIFEEFCVDGMYLYNEPSELLDFVSTVFGKDKGKVILIGNTISRVCPYFHDWNLSRIPQQEQGTIDIYDIETDDLDEKGQHIVIRVAVEYCKSSNSKGRMFFGAIGKTINTGAWKVKAMPKLPDIQQNFETIYTFKVTHMGFSFICDLVVHNETGGTLIFIHPDTKNRMVDRVICKEMSANPFQSEKLNPLKFRAEALVIQTMKEGKVCYSDNMCGTDFNDILVQMKGIY